MLSKRRFVQSLNCIRTCTTQKIDKKSTNLANKIATFTKNVELDIQLKSAIPKQHFGNRSPHLINHLYLIDKKVAESIADHMIPDLLNNPQQLVCDTNSGLGLISRKLIEKGVKSVNLFELCPDFRANLIRLNEEFLQKVKIRNYDLYCLNKFNKFEKQGGGARFQELSKEIPYKAWTDEPCMTIVGPMANLYFISYLQKALKTTYQILSHGRPQVFALMNLSDYLKCTASPESKIYNKTSIMFENFFDHKLLDKYPRNCCLPLPKIKSDKKIRKYFSLEEEKKNMEHIYLVKINLKKHFPVPQENVSHFIDFIAYCMKRQFPPVIPFLERTFPGIGETLILCKKDDKTSFPNINIFTKFIELSPEHWAQIFIKMLEYPEFYDSTFISMIKQKRKNALDDDDEGEAAIT